MGCQRIMEGATELLSSKCLLDMKIIIRKQQQITFSRQHSVVTEVIFVPTESI
jgi:hypothetical protein